MIIDINKKYKTRSGLPVRILCTDRKDDNNYNVVALVSISGTHERVDFYTVKGKYFSNNGELEHYMDLVEVPPIKVDDLVMCWNGRANPKHACLRKYAGISEQGKPMTGNKNGLFNQWDNCMLLEDYVREFM